MKRGSPEASLQRSVFEWLRIAGMPGLIFFHCPNGLVSNGRSVGRMKAAGMTSGIADVCLVRPGGSTAAPWLDQDSVKLSV